MIRSNGGVPKNSFLSLITIGSSINQSIVSNGEVVLPPKKLMEVVEPPQPMIDRLKQSWRILWNALSPKRCKVVLLTGMSGIGKSTLVRSWAHRYRRLYPDAQIYVDFSEGRRGGSAPVQDHLRQKVADMEGGYQRVRDYGSERLSARYASLLSDKRALIVLENVENLDEIRTFEPPNSRSLVLATSTLSKLDMRSSSRRLREIPVDETRIERLSIRDSRRLFVREYRNACPDVGAGGPDKTEVDKFVEYASGIPAVLVYCAQYMAATGKGTSAFISSVHGTEREPETSEFWELWDEMVAHVPEEARACFCLLGIMPMETFPLRLLRRLWGYESVTETRDMSRELRRFNFADRPEGADTEPEPFVISAALHDYARQKARSDLDPMQRRAAIGRVVRYYRELSQAIDYGMSEKRLRLYNRVVVSSDISEFVEAAGPIRAFDDERLCMVSLLLDAAEQPGLAGEIWPIGDALWPAFHESGYHQAGLEFFQLCERMAEKDERPDAQARLLALASRCCADLGDAPGSLRYIDMATNVVGYDNDTLGTSIIEFQGVALSKAGKHDKAIKVYEEALSCFESEGNIRGAMLIYYLLGKEHMANSDLDEASRCLNKAARDVNEKNDTPSAIKVYRMKAEVEYRHSDYLAAKESAEHALALAGSDGYWLHRIRTVPLLVRCLHGLGRDKEALALASGEIAIVEKPEDIEEYSSLIKEFDRWGMGARLRRSLRLARTRRRLRRLLRRRA